MNFKRSKDLLRFFREFNNKIVTDSCGFKAKLLIDFALLQQVPDSNYAKPNPACGTYLSSFMYQKFLQKYPDFIPKSIKSQIQDFDLDNSDLSALSPLRTPTENEMEKVIDFAANPEVQLIVPKFADICNAEEKKLVGVETPLTVYILKKLKKRRKDKPFKPALEVPNEKDPLPNVSLKSKNFERPRVNKAYTTQRDYLEQKPDAKPENKQVNTGKPKSQSTQNNTASQSQKNNKNPNPPKSAPQQPPAPKNPTKILARKPVPVQEKPSAIPVIEPVREQAPIKATVPAPNKPKSKPATKDSIKAFLNSEKSAAVQPSTAQNSQAPPQPKRVFTTAAKKQETQ